MRFNKFKFFSSIFDHICFYPTPLNLNYFWNFGSSAGLFLAIQIVTGLFLSIHYCSSATVAFFSVEHIMRDVNNGWLIRYLHSNGASFFFILLYIHLGRGLYYRSYLGNYYTWVSGIVIFLLAMATAFLGYVLPWGQMSFWGATVITNLFSAVPYIGKHISYLLWGGFSVSDPTLSRFFSLHYLLPFVMVGLVILHLLFLHENGSTAPLTSRDSDKIFFYPYFYIKDMLCFFIILLFYFFIVTQEPNILGHPDNYIEANPLVTPSHIVPEWYFLPFYAILRSIPNKLGGVLLMFLSILIFLLINFLNDSLYFKKLSFLKTLDSLVDPKLLLGYQIIFWCYVVIFILLGWVGAMPAAEPFVTIGLFLSFFYFFFIFFLFSAVNQFEKLAIFRNFKKI